MREASGPLKGLKVFDLTRVLAGPTCVQMLADLGADVIKIEKPGAGDDTRGFAPPFMPGTKESAYFVGVNRNKRSLTLDIAQPEGQAIALELIAQSDILAENFKVGALAKFGLGYDQLKGRFPGLIYCSITGFGQTGPYAPRPGYDSLIQAMGGVMSLTGEPPPRLGNQHPNIVPYQVFATSDGFIVLSIGNDPTFRRFCKEFGLEPLLGDARFASNAARVENRALVTDTLAPVLKRQKTAWWVERLEALQIGCGPINTLKEVFADPQVKARGAVVDMPHAATPAGVKVIANPVRLSETPPDYRLPPPLLGEHTDDVLRERLGMGAAEIAELRRKGIV